MSDWTHIVSNLYIDTFKESKNIEEFVRGAVSQAPHITGSEHDVDIFINELTGYNTFLWVDDSNEKEEGYQTCVSISIVGNLRDRDIKTTEKEFLDFAKYIEKNFYVLYGVCAIYDDYGNKKNINF